MAAKRPALDQARLDGSPTYETGKPCKHGHTAPRLTRNSTCIECNRDYQRDYDVRHPETRRAWLARNRVRLRAKGAAWKKANPEKVKAGCARYYRANREKVNAFTAKWWADNPDKLGLYRKQYRETRPHLHNAVSAKRRAKKMAATPVWADVDAMSAIYEDAVIRSKQTGVQHEVDHVVPLVSKIVCGLHCPANLAVVTTSENRKKANRWWPDMPERED